MSRPTPKPENSGPENLIAALAADAQRRASGDVEPSPEELLDYLAGKLSPEAEERVARQLVANPEAARMLLELSELAQAEPPVQAPGAPADFMLEAGWRELEKRRAAADQAQRRRLPPWLLGLAAALLLITAGLGWRVLRLESERRRPVANLASLELISGSRAGELQTATLSPGEPLRLVLKPATECPSYDAELTGSQTKARQSVSGIERDPLGRLGLLLFLEPGEYALLLSGCEPRRELERHRFLIARRDAG